MHPICSSSPIFAFPKDEFSVLELFELIDGGAKAQVMTLIRNNPNLLKLNDLSGNTPLHQACWRGELEMVEFMIEQGANVNARNCCKATPLMYAAQEQHIGICEQLLKGGVEIDYQDEDQQTALFFLLVRGDTPQLLPLFQLFLDYGANPYHKAANNFDISTAAFYYQANSILPILQEWCIKTEVDPVAFYDKYKDRSSLPKVLTQEPYPLLSQFFIYHKMVALSYGVKCLYTGRDKKVHQLDSSLIQDSLKGVIDLVRQSTLENKKKYGECLEETLSFSRDFLKTPFRSFVERNKRDIQAYVFGYKSEVSDECHAVSLVFSKSQRLLFKGDGAEVDGLKSYTIGNVEKLSEAVYYLSCNIFSAAARTFFKTDINQYLSLTPHHKFSHKPIKVGKCAIRASKLLIKSLAFLEYPQFKFHVIIHRSFEEYKHVARLDRDKEREYVERMKEFQQKARDLKLTKEDLEKFGIIPEKVLKGIFFECLKDKFVDKVAYLLTHFPELIVARSDDSDNSTPLICAAKNESPKVFLKLLEHGADVKIKIDRALSECSIIHFCMCNKMFPVVPEILKLDPKQVNAQDEEGNTPLHYAVTHGKKKLVKLLLSMGAEPLVKKDSREIPGDSAKPI